MKEPIQNRTPPPGRNAVPRKRRWRRWLFGLGTVVFILVLFAVFVDVNRVAVILQQAHFGYLAAAAVVLLGSLAAYTLRWQVLIRTPTSFHRAFLVSNLGHMLNLWLPLRPGDAARVVALGSGGEPGMPETTSSIVVERWLEQIMRLVALGMAVAFGAGMALSPLSLAGVVFVLAAVFGLILWMLAHRARVLRRWPPALSALPRLSEDRAQEILAELLDGLQVVSSPVRLAYGFGWSVATWVLFWVSNYLTLLALAPGLASGDLIAISMGALVLAPPSAPAQPGVYQGTVVVALGVTGYDENLLTAYSLLLQIIQLVWMTPFGLWGLARAGLSWRELAQPAEQDPPAGPGPPASRARAEE